MRRLLWLLLAAASGVLLAGAIATRPGYLLLAWGDWRVEIRSLLVALLLAALLFGALYWLLGSANRARQALRRHSLRRLLRQREQSQSDLAAGVLAVLDGRYAQGEKLLQRCRHGSTAPVLPALLLAHLARLRGDRIGREREFVAARAAAPQAHVAIAQLEARAALDAGDLAAAASALKNLPEHDNPRLLELKARLARAQKDWPALHDLLPRLRRAGLIDTAQAAREEASVACARLDASEVPQLLWPQLSRRLRRDGAVRIAYAQALRNAGQHDTAQELLGELLREDWRADAIVAFGHYAGSDPQRWLAAAEGWLPPHRDDPTLLLALGRLARQARQWAKARSYYDSGLLLTPTPDGHFELGQLLDALDQPDAAAHHYRAGLQLALSSPDARDNTPSASPGHALTGGAAANDDRPPLLPYEA